MAQSLDETIKQIVGNYIAAQDLTTFLYGTVTRGAPLEIQIDADKKLTLGMDFLVLTSAVRDIDLDVEIEWETETGGKTEPHKHEIKKEKKMKIKNALKTGEKVILIRQQGGQKYLVVDRA